MNILKLNAAFLQMVDTFSRRTPNVDVGYVVQESGYIERGGNSFGDIWSEGEKLTGALRGECYSHHTDKELYNGVFTMHQ